MENGCCRDDVKTKSLEPYYSVSLSDEEWSHAVTFFRHMKTKNNENDGKITYFSAERPRKFDIAVSAKRKCKNEDLYMTVSKNSKIHYICVKCDKVDDFFKSIDDIQENIYDIVNFIGTLPAPNQCVLYLIYLIVHTYVRKIVRLNCVGCETGGQLSHSLCTLLPFEKLDMFVNEALSFTTLKIFREALRFIIARLTFALDYTSAKNLFFRYTETRFFLLETLLYSFKRPSCRIFREIEFFTDMLSADEMGFFE